MFARAGAKSDPHLMRRGGLGVETPILNTFLVLTAFNSVLPEIVVLISTTSSGRTELNAVSTRKVVERWSKSGFRPPDPTSPPY